MKKVEEFQSTQKLIEEYKALGSKIPELENKIKQNEIMASTKIARLEEDMSPKWEDEEFNLNKKEIIEECKKQINQVKEDSKKEKELLTKEIEEAKDSQKYFRTDDHFKIITMEIEEIKEEIRKEEIELKKKDLELLEFNMEEKHDDPLKWQEIYKEQDKIKQNISELNAKIEEYSKFKEELNSINLTPEEYKIMVEKENKRIAEKMEPRPAEQEEMDFEELFKPVEPRRTEPEEIDFEELFKPVEPRRTEPEEIDFEELFRPVEPRRTEPEEIDFEELFRPVEPRTTEPEEMDFEELFKPVEPRNKGNVEIWYSAKRDTYLVQNKENNKKYKLVYNDLPLIDIESIKEKYGIEESAYTDYIDPNMVTILEDYDIRYGTNKTIEYLENTLSTGISKEERQDKMKESSINIKYDLRGLYDKKRGFSKEDRKQILSNAKNAKEGGVATVKKGIKVTMMEFADKAMDWLGRKGKNLLPKSKVVALDSAETEEQEEKQDILRYIKVDDKIKGKIDEVSKQFNKDMSNPAYNIEVNRKLNEASQEHEVH